jgi:hypothetical protein
MAGHTPQQSHLAHNGSGTKPLNREGLAPFIPTQKPELALHHQGNTRGEAAVVVKLLARAQPQWLQGFCQAGLAGLGELIKRGPPFNNLKSEDEIQWSTGTLDRRHKQHF